MRCWARFRRAFFISLYQGGNKKRPLSGLEVVGGKLPVWVQPNSAFIAPSRGKIEQIGTPQEIYRTPRTRFVADFLGSSNIFSGKIKEADVTSVALDTASGLLRLGGAKPDQRLHVGETASLTVLDTKMRVSLTEPEGAVNVVPVRVIGEEFVGATATLYLETAQGQEIRVQKGHEELAEMPLEIGQRVFTYWVPEDGHLVAET